MISLSVRARRELALLRAMDALRVLAAVTLPLHFLPLACVLYSFLSMGFAWLVLFLGWSMLALVFHWLLIRWAETVLEQPQRSVPLALLAATCLLLILGGGQILISMLFGVGVMLVVLLTCGLFDVLSIGALIYAYWTSLRAAFGRIDAQSDRHIGFEVKLPEAFPVQEDG